MRVLMVSDVYFPRINGVSTSIETFRAALAEETVDVALIAPDYGDGSASAGVTRVPSRPVPGDPEDRLARYGALRRACLAVARDCDLVHVQTPFAAHYAGLGAARKLGKPVLATYHTLFEEYLHHYVPWLPAALPRAIARHFSRRQCNDLDAVIVPSTAMRERLRAYGVRRPLHVLPT
ncbi:MAG: 1 2-diacylglycerol 3-glucosyltransferase, partial [bacterium]